MKRKNYGAWLNFSYGKKLKKLHAMNAYVVTSLAISGIILFLPIRGTLGKWRVLIRDLHIGLGIASVVLLALYLPLLVKHWKQLKKKWNQRGNLSYVLFVLVGWSVTGIILWLYREVPQEWTNYALVGHDLFTWIGIPYAIYHSISRSRWVKQMNNSKAKTAPVTEKKLPLINPEIVSAQYVDPSEQNAYPPEGGRNWMSRRKFMRIASGTVITAAVSPFFYRWMKGNFFPEPPISQPVTINRNPHPLTDPLADPTAEASAVLTPQPLPASDPPIGGGGQGRFRIYTVTKFPEFDAKTWKFEISGLVDAPQQYDWKQFLDLKRQVQVSDFHCVTGWSVYHLTWEGIPLSALLDSVKVNPKAKFVRFYSSDKVYTDTLSIEQAFMKDIMVAVLMDGNQIPQKMGGPVRLVVPKMYTYKSVKWLEKIELVEKDTPGYWEVRGYDTNAWVNNRSSL